MTTRLPALAAAALMLCACPGARYHRDTNAPGIIDVATPPRPNDAPDEPRLPDDPGERMFTVNPGVFSSAGALTAKDDEFTSTLGVEVSLNWGENPRSHYKDGFFVYPLTGYGLSVGWAALQYRAEDADLGPLYVELGRFRAFTGASIGYAVNPSDFDSGPQASAWAGPFYVRVRYLIDGGTEFHGGAQIKVPFVWIWSR